MFTPVKSGSILLLFFITTCVSTIYILPLLLDQPTTETEMDQTNKDDPKYTVRQLKVNLPQYVLDEIRALAKQANVPQGILIRNAYALAKVYYDETQAGNRMTISDSDDVAIKEIILPE